MEILHTPPTPSAFTPLSTHQSSTPPSFFSGPPILYHHSPSTTLSFHTYDLTAAPALRSLAAGGGGVGKVNGTANGVTNGHGEGTEEGGGEEEAEAGEEEDTEITVQGVDVYVTSSCVPLRFPPSPSTTTLTSPLQQIPPSLLAPPTHRPFNPLPLHLPARAATSFPKPHRHHPPHSAQRARKSIPAATLVGGNL